MVVTAWDENALAGEFSGLAAISGEGADLDLTMIAKASL